MVTFEVVSREGNTSHTSFASASGQASAMTGTRYIKATIQDFRGSHSGSLYKYEAGQSERLLVNRGFLVCVNEALISQCKVV